MRLITINKKAQEVLENTISSFSFYVFTCHCDNSKIVREIW